MASTSPVTDVKAMDEGRKNKSFADPRLEVLHPIALRTMIRSSNRIVFLHPPKTGGTNLVFIAEGLDKSKKLKNKRFAVNRIPQVSPILITAGWQGGLLSAKETLSRNPNCFKGSGNQLLTQAEAFATLCGDYNFISGHFPFGLISHVADRNIGLVREPLSRELSSLNFDFQRGFVNKEDAEQYLLTKQIDNAQTRLFAGEQYMSGPCTIGTFKKAIDNIEKHFFLVGITEEVNTFIQVIATIQNWGRIALCRSQVTGEKVFKELSPHLQAALVKKHEFDIKLYEWVKERWNKWKGENLLEVKPLEPDAKTLVLCITAEFASTKTPIFFTMEQIVQHNSMQKAALLEVTQHHSEVKPLPLLNVGVVTATAPEKASPLLLNEFPPQKKGAQQVSNPLGQVTVVEDERNGTNLKA